MLFIDADQLTILCEYPLQMCGLTQGVIMGYDIIPFWVTTCLGISCIVGLFPARNSHLSPGGMFIVWQGDVFQGEYVHEFHGSVAIYEIYY